MSLKGLAGSFVALLAVAFAVLYQQSPVIRLLLSTPTHNYTNNSGCTHIQGEFSSLSVTSFLMSRIQPQGRKRAKVSALNIVAAVDALYYNGLISSALARNRPPQRIRPTLPRCAAPLT